MNRNKMIKKISFNMTVVSGVLLGSIVLSDNYRLTPDITLLTGICVASSVTFVKTRRCCKKRDM